MTRFFTLLACCLFPMSMAFADSHDASLEAEAPPPGEVARATFTVDIQDREPILTLQAIPEGMNEVYLFTDLRDFEDQTVTHRWIYDGNTEAEVEFDVGGPRWRTWSLKSIPEHQRGEWTVEVVDGAGFIVESYSITAR